VSDLRGYMEMDQGAKADALLREMLEEDQRQQNEYAKVWLQLHASLDSG